MNYWEVKRPVKRGQTGWGPSIFLKEKQLGGAGSFGKERACKILWWGGERG